MTRVAHEFSRFATTYSQHNIIQTEVAQKLVSDLPQKHYEKILDLGCGRGEIYHNLRDQGITFEHLTALDISAEMLRLHPSLKGIAMIEGDFAMPEVFSSLPYRYYDVVVSASALQWSGDLEMTLSQLSAFSDRFYFAIFTAGTFRSLHHCAGITSPIYSEAFLRKKISEHMKVRFETVSYTLHFDSVYKMLRYIKESGTSGGERQLSYTQTKQLLESYPHNFLEFEVLFAYSKS
ncbi:MAG TPA: methyltransferase domain-containing protein [Epsilonproteobacteria bacterium]|nr:methyltransferase domain-containing protein [Campylobacterota bacterium]